MGDKKLNSNRAHFLLPGLLAALILSGCYFWPQRREARGALTPEEAAEQVLAGNEGPHSKRLGFFDPDRAVMVTNRLGLVDEVEMGFAVVIREQGFWISREAGGMGFSGSQEAFILNAITFTSIPDAGLLFGLTRDEGIQRVEAGFSSGETRLDDPQNDIYLFPFRLDDPPCRLRFLGEVDAEISGVDLLNPPVTVGMPEGITDAVRVRCTGS